MWTYCKTMKLFLLIEKCTKTDVITWPCHTYFSFFFFFEPVCIHNYVASKEKKLLYVSCVVEWHVFDHWKCEVKHSLFVPCLKTLFITRATNLSPIAETHLHTEPPAQFFTFWGCHRVARGQRHWSLKVPRFGRIQPWHLLSLAGRWTSQRWEKSILEMNEMTYQLINSS